jgi:hypothetical protein
VHSLGGKCLIIRSILSVTVPEELRITTKNDVQSPRIEIQVVDFEAPSIIELSNLVCESDFFCDENFGSKYDVNLRVRSTNLEGNFVVVTATSGKALEQLAQR